MRPRPDDPRRLPGWRLRRLAQGVCSPETLEHVVVLAASRHLVRNAFGTTAEERTFQYRAGVGTLCALAASTFIVVLYGIVTLTRSLVYLLTHLRWPGPPTVADVLPAALEMATNQRGLLLLLPCLVVGTLPPSLLFGILHGVRSAGTTPPATLRPFLRSVAGALLSAALATLALTGWVVPASGQRYREFSTASIFSQAKPGHPARDLRELSLTELEDQAQAEEAAGRGESSQRYRVEWHRRLAWAAASLVFGLLGLALAASRRAWTSRQTRAVTLAATALYYWGLTRVTLRALDLAPSSPFLVVWSADIAIALVAAALILRAHWPAKSSLVAV